MVMPAFNSQQQTSEIVLPMKQKAATQPVVAPSSSSFPGNSLSVATGVANSSESLSSASQPAVLLGEASFEQEEENEMAALNAIGRSDQRLATISVPLNYFCGGGYLSLVGVSPPSLLSLFLFRIIRMREGNSKSPPMSPGLHISSRLPSALISLNIHQNTQHFLSSHSDLHILLSRYTPYSLLLKKN